jgi:hypothetical protein
VNELRRIHDPMNAFVPDLDEEAGEEGRPPTARNLHPYYAAELHPDTGGVLAAFEEGFADDEYVVVVLGGSAAGQWAIVGKDAFVRRLEQDPRFAGRRVRLLNFGHAAAKQPQQLTRLAFLTSLSYVPDAVINLDGFNEVCDGIENARRGSSPAFPNYQTWGNLIESRGRLTAEELDLIGAIWAAKQESHRVLEGLTALKLHHSAIFGQLARKRIEALAGERKRAEQELLALRRKNRGKRRSYEITGPAFPKDEQLGLEVSLSVWLESSRSMHAICDERGIHYVHVLQPALHDGPSRPTKTALEQSIPSGGVGWTLGATEGYPLLREAGRRLEELGIVFCDASTIFAAEEQQAFVDPVHLTAFGNRILTEAVADAFLAHLPP